MRRQAEEPKGDIVSTSAAKQKYAALRNKIAEARKTMEETAKGLFTEMTSELFNDNPTLMAFGWTQYTPYFNDGDVCTFRCNSDYPTLLIKVGDDLIAHDSNSGELEINGEEVRSTYELQDTFKSLGVDSYTKGGKLYAYDKATKAVTVDGVKIPTYDDYEKLFDAVEGKVTEFLGSFEDEDMQTMFGDHQTITVSRNGSIETEDYEHD
jgi:hypothetical protein